MEEKNVRKNQNNKDSKKIKNINIKDKKKFVISMSIIVLLVIIIILIICLNKKIDITKVDDYSSLNSSKYSQELHDKYQLDENKNKFLEDYDYIQGAVGVYIITNSTSDSDSFANRINEVKNILKKEEWDKLSIDKPSFWNGIWNINDEGILSFKFGNKKIEPNWINDEEIENKIEKN